ncbi:MAG: ribbon-helix-helix protein, CopG family [Actinobacteria bacterium]|nr:MAG: ribbon-helix-helix protein, CopG family [Actinomycetota bacterium]
MRKARTTITLDERVLRAVRVKAARSGRRNSDVIEEALRRDLGIDLLERAWKSAELGDDQALEVAVDVQHEARRSGACGQSPTRTS